MLRRRSDQARTPQNRRRSNRTSPDRKRRRKLRSSAGLRPRSCTRSCTRRVRRRKSTLRGRTPDRNRRQPCRPRSSAGRSRGRRSPRSPCDRQGKLRRSPRRFPCTKEEPQRTGPPRGPRTDREGGTSTRVSPSSSQSRVRDGSITENRPTPAENLDGAQRSRKMWTSTEYSPSRDHSQPTRSAPRAKSSSHATKPGAADW